MALRLHHLTCYVSPGGSEHKLLDQLGLASSTPAEHPGQGTVGLPYHFRNSFLELAWAEDETPMAEPAALALHQRERMRWPETEGNPFAIVLTRAARDVPLPTRPMVAPGTPPMPIDVGENVDRLDEPLVMVLPEGAGVLRPASGVRTQAQLGLNSITCIEFTLTQPPSPTLEALAATGVVRLRRGKTAHAFIEVDGGRRGQRVDMVPMLDLGFIV